jgi:hypothetical protein
MRSLSSERLKSTYEIDAAAVPSSRSREPKKNQWVPHLRGVFVLAAKVGYHDPQPVHLFSEPACLIELLL